MRIPKIIHQLWKTHDIPERWHESIASVKRMHDGWEYRLWTDPEMFEYVQTKHPDLYPAFMGMNRHIMRVDVFRYVLMHDIGGMYCDLDYEFLRPFDYGDAEVVLSYEYQVAYGDQSDSIANYVFASVPGHALWADILADVEANTPHSPSAPEVCIVTGPGLMTRFALGSRDKYHGIDYTDKPVLSPRRVHGRHERKFYINSGNIYGFHHGWGSWRERLNRAYLKTKLKKYGQWLRRPHL
ncbi:MAG: glycosyltransferase [Gammaproteobacteria bacterium]